MNLRCTSLLGDSMLISDLLLLILQLAILLCLWRLSHLRPTRNGRSENSWVKSQRQSALQSCNSQWSSFSSPWFSLRRSRINPKINCSGPFNFTLNNIYPILIKKQGCQIEENGKWATGMVLNFIIGHFFHASINHKK